MADTLHLVPERDITFSTDSMCCPQSPLSAFGCVENYSATNPTPDRAGAAMSKWIEVAPMFSQAPWQVRKSTCYHTWQFLK